MELASVLSRVKQFGFTRLESSDGEITLFNSDGERFGKQEFDKHSTTRNFMLSLESYGLPTCIIEIFPD